jgi:transposase
MKYIGLDGHSSTCDFSVSDSKGVEIDRRTIATNGRLIVDYMRSISGAKRMVFEESDLSHWLFGLLKEEADEVLVCNPIESARYKQKKTDKLDARDLAELLRGNFIKSVYHDGSEREQYRMLMSGYNDLIGEIVRGKNRYKALYRKRGKKLTGESVYPKRELLQELGTGDERFMGEKLFSRLESLDEDRVSYVERIRKTNKKFKEIKHLKTIPGIGDLQAAKIVSQVVDPKRFRNKYKLWSYCGLARHNQISGGRNYGSKKIHGNLILKSVFKSAAHMALRSDEACRSYYEKLRAQGANHEEARNAVSRRLAAASLYVWKYAEGYNGKKLHG